MRGRVGVMFLSCVYDGGSVYRVGMHSDVLVGVVVDMFLVCVCCSRPRVALRPYPRKGPLGQACKHESLTVTSCRIRNSVEGIYANIKSNPSSNT